MSMKLSELIKQLDAMKTEHGDLPVKVQTLTHTWAPEPVVRGTIPTKYVLLNP